GKWLRRRRWSSRASDARGEANERPPTVPLVAQAGLNGLPVRARAVLLADLRPDPLPVLLTHGALPDLGRAVAGLATATRQARPADPAAPGHMGRRLPVRAVRLLPRRRHPLHVRPGHPALGPWPVAVPRLAALTAPVDGRAPGLRPACPAAPGAADLGGAA